MSVKLEISPSEQYVAPDRVLAEDVFNAVSQSFLAETRNSSVHQTMAESDSGFVEARLLEAERIVEPLASRPIRPSDIKDKLMNEAFAEAQKANNPIGIGVQIEGATRVVSGFLQRASVMFANKETDGLTVKLFFDRLQDLGLGLKVGYDHLVAKHDEPEPSQESRLTYTQAIETAFDGKPDVAEQENGGFLHINKDRFLASEEIVDERYYISPKLNGRPEEAVKTWAETLNSLGLGDTLYYKVAGDLMQRYDTIVAYATPKTADDMERAVKEFTLRCPPELLSDTIIPAGAEVAKGIARAPEPYQLNALLRYCGKRKVSYNQFACALTELALQRASFDFVKQGIGPDQVAPEALNMAAKPYFIQFVQLSGLDPVTMKSGQWWT